MPALIDISYKSMGLSPVCQDPVAYAAAVLVDTPIAFYKCQDLSGNPQDSSGNGNHMTSTGAVNYSQAGPFGNDLAIRFNAVTCSRSAVLVAQDNWTLEAWVKFNAATGGNHSIFGNNNGGSNGYELVQTNTNIDITGVAQGTGLVGPSGQHLSTATWYHIVMQRSSTVWKYYINGRYDCSYALTTTPPTPSSATTNINRDAGSDITVAYYALYNAALTPARVLAHYQAGLNP